jgi:hypothetical protein
MTTLVAVSTKDALVMGCDSLGTVTTPSINPWDLRDFFDEQYDILTDSAGKPLLRKFNQIYEKMEEIPYDQMSHVNKLCSLQPLPIGVMATGITSISDRTIRSLITELKRNDKGFKDPDKLTNFTVRSVAQRILAFISPLYDSKYPKDGFRPHLELIIGGYDKKSQVPSINRIYVHQNSIEPTLGDEPFGVVFGGEMREIGRIVHGTDLANRYKMMARNDELLTRYHVILSDELAKQNISFTLPKPDAYKDKLSLFGDDWNLDGFEARMGDFSEQNAIEFVDFLIDIMIKSQQFSSRLPVVGGEKHIAIITKTSGFRWVSEERLVHGTHSIPMEKKGEE